MSKSTDVGYTPLYFSFLAGLCGNASISTLFTNEVAFSIFPLIALALVIYNCYQIYMTTALEKYMSRASIGLFVVGFLAYSSFIRVEHPELGSNFFPLMGVMIIAVWVAKTLGLFSQKKTEKEA